MFSYLGSVLIGYRLRAETGLRIGGSKENFEIGGLDNPVIKLTATVKGFYGDRDLREGTPYIPGSSLKGKIRSLLEWADGKVEDMIRKANGDINEAGRPHNCGRCDICKVFGTGEAKVLEELSLEEQPGPPRAKFFDAYPTKEWYIRIQEEIGEGLFTEIKTENQINRINSRANPRKMERVPAGAEFEGEIIFDLYKEEDKDLIRRVLLRGMKMLENSYLGGSGSRGSGRVRFVEVVVKKIPREFYTGDGEIEEITRGSLDKVMRSWEEVRGRL